jgi:2-polyprenyl-3-methyl-5-hydroxy-6-metoxy-1,4-benzoquinol methylase
LSVESARLTEQSDWEGLYGDDRPAPRIELTQSYEIFVFGKLIPGLLSAVTPGSRLIELGSAPGRYALLIARQINATPFGVEYTETGAKLNKKTFQQNGVSPDNVFHDDFLNPEFRARHKEAFDVVSSFGLIEHFEDPASAVAAHIDLVKPGGMLVISIPNYRGWNGLWMKWMCPEIARGHNFDIMKLETFKKLFQMEGFTPKYLGMAGQYHFMPSSQKSGLRRFAHLVHINLEPAIRWLLSGLARFVNVESRYFSPYLLYVGQKADTRLS